MRLWRQLGAKDIETDAGIIIYTHIVIAHTHTSLTIRARFVKVHTIFKATGSNVGREIGGLARSVLYING